jgi:hypothetical protein
MGEFFFKAAGNLAAIAIMDCIATLFSKRSRAN